MALKDFPEIQAAFNRLMDEKNAILDKTKKMRADRDDVAAKIGSLQDKKKKLAEEIDAIEKPRLVEIDTQLAAMAKATGGKSLNS